MVSNWKKVEMQMLCRCTAMEMTTENCYQNGDKNRKLFSKCMEMTTENCFQNAELMHRDMEIKTENCFQNAWR